MSKHNEEWFAENDTLLQSILKESQNLSNKIEHIIETKPKLTPECDETMALLKKKILRGDELLLLPDMPNNFIIDKFIWQDDVVVMLAKEKVGKTILALQMACAMTCGEHFLGEYEVPEEKKVLYIQAEGSKYETIDRIKRMTQRIKWKPENFYHMYTPSIKLANDKVYAQLINDIIDAGFKPDVIFLDPLYMSVGGSLCSDDLATDFCERVGMLKAQYDGTFVIVHHKRRPSKDKNGNYMEESDDNEIMGSFVWKAFPSHILNLVKKSNGLRALSCETQRNGAVVKGMELMLHGDPEARDPLYFEIHGSADHMPYVDKVKHCITGFGVNGTDRKGIMGLTSLTISAVNKSINYLMGDGVNAIERVNPGGRPVFYRRKV